MDDATLLLLILGIGAVIWYMQLPSQPKCCQCQPNMVGTTTGMQQAFQSITGSIQGTGDITYDIGRVGGVPATFGTFVNGKLYQFNSISDAVGPSGQSIQDLLNSNWTGQQIANYIVMSSG